MLKSCCAIVLRITRYNDKTDIMDTYTNIGRISFAVNKSRKKGKASIRQLCHPLSILNIETDINTKNSIHKIREASPATILRSIPLNPAKLSISFFIAEFLTHILQEDMEDTQTFEYIKNSIEWLDNSKNGFANFHLVFLIRISRLLGLKPDMSTYHEGQIFDMQNAIFTSTLPEHGIYLNPDDTASLYNLMRLRYETMHLFKMNRLERNRCLDIIMRYYSLHITDLGNMKSVDVLKELFN